MCLYCRSLTLNHQLWSHHRRELISRDVNARFSGISQDQLDKAVMDIKGVRAACLMFIGPDTVLVGHGSATLFEPLSADTDLQS